MIQEELQNIKTEALKEIESAYSLDLLENIWRKYLGRHSRIRDYSLKLKSLSGEERSRAGKLINEFKSSLEAIITDKKNKLESVGQRGSKEIPDLTLSLVDQKINFGHLHPHTLVKYRVAEIFHSMGFEILEGPEVENEYYNFDALNMPETHPARDMWDTFWLQPQTRTYADKNADLRGQERGLTRKTDADQRGKSLRGSALSQRQSTLLLRTHTTNMQVRVMEKQKPPLRVCVIGKCYRHEATDASHEHSLYQIDGFAVDENISVANLIYTLKTFLRHLFGQEVKVRLRPSYFPFTEPSFELDFSCLKCGGAGCPVCGRSGWVEILGCGMIHPNVFSAAGYPRGKYTGFAFGIGLDRLVMMRYKIDDIRWFHSGDLRFLKQF